ncbi:hypothetical protein FGO68_gene7473 [Halteria grandinella]|uniref:Uncharacterized protein n=1 Tax=Halteria grandinella TaxID=5974 RepID=A0A8J8NPU6_HALGN|nr:hypothetical protein FGO68_gene7473 [Halteria grandinella]
MDCLVIYILKLTKLLCSAPTPLFQCILVILRVHAESIIHELLCTPSTRGSVPSTSGGLLIIDVVALLHDGLFNPVVVFVNNLLLQSIFIQLIYRRQIHVYDYQVKSLLICPLLFQFGEIALDLKYQRVLPFVVD